MIDGLRKKGAPNLDLMPDGRGYPARRVRRRRSPSKPPDAAERLHRAHEAAAPARRATRLYTHDRSAGDVEDPRSRGRARPPTAPGHAARWEGWDDAAVAPEKLGRVPARSAGAAGRISATRPAFYGHFGHGCIHMQISFDLQTEHGIRKYGEFVDRAADLVVGYGGSLSGEHGDGQSRGALLPKMFGRRADAALSRVQGDLGSRQQDEPAQARRRLPADREPAARRRLRAASSRATHFAFPDDDGSFARASLRCIGLGECRKHDAGTMCPSYMVTLEEEHSTRGRAHMLFELLQGEVLRGRLEGRARQASRSTCACPARRASPSARPTSTSRPTAPSSSRTTTRASGGRCTRTRSG